MCQNMSLHLLHNTSNQLTKEINIKKITSTLDILINHPNNPLTNTRYVAQGFK